MLADGVMSEAEQQSLKRLQQRFRLSDAEVQAMTDRAREGQE